MLFMQKHASLLIVNACQGFINKLGEDCDVLKCLGHAPILLTTPPVSSGVCVAMKSRSRLVTIIEMCMYVYSFTVRG